MKNAMFLVAACLMAAPVMANPVADASAAPAKKLKDPNARICEEVLKTGSRLGARKVCLTAAQWEAKRAEHRTELERAQKNSGILNGN